MGSVHILAVDTTSMDGSVAIFRDSALVAERRWTAIDSHSNRLISEIDAGLESVGLRVEDIAYFAPVTGPGSFTGIRIGLGTVQGLASAGPRPIVGITALEALAFAASPSETPVAAVIDARRNQIFAQAFRHAGGNVEPLNPPCCELPDSWLAGLKAGPMHFVGNGATLYQRRIEAASSSFVVLNSTMWLASPAGRIAARRIESGKVKGDNYVDALYIRPPDVLKAKPSAETG